VTARQWSWDFTYPNGHVADTLHVATGQPVRLNLRSEDVEHALSIPAVRVNQAVQPGREATAWFEATEPGTFPLQAGLFNGDSLTAMNSALVVHESAEFQKWLESVSDIFQGRTLVEVGELLYNRQGCAVCHTTDGTPRVGPTFLNMYGYEFDTVEGTRVTVDDAYVKESILYPNVSVIAGYQPVMTAYEGILDDRDIEAITAWLKSISDRGGDPEAASAPADTTAVEQEEN
jgi:cytochrome c oxidase subunit 2